MSYRPCYPFLAEDGERVGEIRGVPRRQQGWRWSAWAVSECESEDEPDGFRRVKLGLHETISDAIAEIRRYWGML